MTRTTPLPPPTPTDRASAGAIVASAGLDLPDYWPAPSDPMGVARRLLAECQVDGHRTLHHHQGAWMRWLGSHWAEVEAAEISRWIYARTEDAVYLHTDARGNTEPRPWRPNKTKVAHVLDALIGLTLLPRDVTAPSWFDGPELAPAGQLVALRNGLLHVGNRTLLPHTPTLYNLVGLPFDFDPAPPPPTRWREFLAQLWPGDAEAVTALQEWFGYSISGRTDLHKILLLVGPPRSGKGTIARVLHALMGAGNCASPTLASLAGNFGLQPLIGKSLATIGDARLGTRVDSSQVVERLLSVSGEDAISVDRKFREAWYGKLPTRFMILSNELPRLGDASTAIARRFITLTLQQSFLGHEDVTLGDALLGELPGILSWALDGLDRLASRNAFIEPASSAEAIAELHELVSPVSAFFRERCEFGGEVGAEQLYQAWASWAGANGHHVGSTQTFGRDLRAAVPALRVMQPRIGGRQVRHYVGLHLVPHHATNGAYVTASPVRPSAGDFMKVFPGQGG